ncbi:MAG TPA: sigma 54-interacting transcriptional regulator [Terriglobales bacterium]|jgi:Nif-specific regulatory protein|nr:sigma 54-interacting transcriptional regulator [Terriglobales bacterium]
MSPRLLGVAGPFQDTAVALSEKEVSIGRDSSNDLWVADRALSRRHCLLVNQSEQFILRDLGSKNGTLVNGVPVTEQVLRDGDQITIGDSVFVFQLKPVEVHLEKSPVEFSETGKIEYQVLLRPEDSVYLPSTNTKDSAQSSRVDRDLNSLLKIASGIGGIRNQESLQWQLLGLIFDVVPAERGAVVLFNPAGEFNAAVGWDRLRGPAHAVRVSRTVLQRVRTERVGVVVSDVSEDPAFAQSQSLKDLRVHSVVCVPLIASGKVIGAIYLDSSNPKSFFDETHLQMMTAIAGISSLAFENVRHWEGLQQENQELRAQVGLGHNMLGSSPRMREVFEFIRRAAPTDSTVLVEGESGTGKELVARAIHRNSSRNERPFVAINCAAIAETLLESELFGHEKGAFTGAAAQKKGKIETADGGTLFLDEVTELAPGLQAKLLRVLQEREFERVGGLRPLKLDIRLIAATNRNLAEAVKSGAFRNDLYYRLNVVALAMPPLRDRREDIPLLAEYFIAKAARKCKTKVKPLSAKARACLVSYDWPGNVRELENAMERALVLGSSDSILPDDLPEAVLEAGSLPAATAANFHGTIREQKKELILQALQNANGNYIAAANALEMHPNSLLRLIRTLDLKAAVKAGSPSQGTG